MDTKFSYFTADAHLGAYGLGPEVERRLVAWLERIAPTAREVYFLGDTFDYWYEYRHVIPRGHIAFLSAVRQLTLWGVEVHFLAGNHDCWMGDFMRQELGAEVHAKAVTIERNGKRIRLAHGDAEYADRSLRERMLYNLFRTRWAQAVYGAIHPGLTISVAHRLSRLSRKLGNRMEMKAPAFDLHSEWLYQWTSQFSPMHPEIDAYIFGHTHQYCMETLPSGVQLFLLGDWKNAAQYILLDDTGELSLRSDTL